MPTKHRPPIKKQPGWPVTRRLLPKAEQRYGQSGEKTEENLLDHKIAGVYKYSLKYVKEYDQKQAAKNKSVEKSGPATQKHLAEALSRGGYE